MPFARRVNHIAEMGDLEYNLADWKARRGSGG